MQITLIQSKIYWENKKDNLKMFARKISEAPDSDLILLPEMFVTGFSMNAPLYSIQSFEIEDWLKKQAFEKKSALCGSVMVQDQGRYFNRLFFVTPVGLVYTYDKKHLFTLAGEQKIYTPGNKSIIIDYNNWRIKPLICYDLRFPVWSRNLEDYDLLLYIANWPQRRSEAWTSL